jgi:F0F1-type ATP synthase membrane subunit b/b'
MIILAQVTPHTPTVDTAFWGQWIIVGLGIIGGLGGLAAIASYFATRRELIALEQRTTKVESRIENDQRDNNETFAIKADVAAQIANLDKEDKSLHTRIGAVDREAKKQVSDTVQHLSAALTVTSNQMHELKGEMKQLTSQLVLVQQELQNR